MEHTTFLQDLIGLLISVGIPLVLVMVLVIKNPQTTLSLIKAVFKLLVSAGKFIAPFIMPFLIWITDRWAIHDDDEPYWPSSNDYGSSTADVDKVRTYQNGVDGAKRCGTTFYH
jgi:hypothetical protein